MSHCIVLSPHPAVHQLTVNRWITVFKTVNAASMAMSPLFSICSSATIDKSSLDDQLLVHNGEGSEGDLSPQ